jgi:hypothetical protein
MNPATAAQSAAAAIIGRILRLNAEGVIPTLNTERD